MYFTKAKMWHAESKNDYARALQRQRMARRKLAKLAGIPEAAQLVADSLTEVSKDIDDIVRIAIENRPEFELVRERIELAVRQNKFERLKLMPWPTFIEMSYHKEKRQREDWGELMVGFNLPLFNWNLGNIRATNLAVQKERRRIRYHAGIHR